MEDRRAARRRARSEKKPTRYQGHPASVAAQKRADGPPDARELELRKLTRLVRAEARNAEEGLLVGPLAAAARYAAPILAAHYGLDDEEHEAAIADYLTEQLGAVLDEFSIVAYRDWRQECLV